MCCVEGKDEGIWLFRFDPLVSQRVLHENATVLLKELQRHQLRLLKKTRAQGTGDFSDGLARLCRIDNPFVVLASNNDVGVEDYCDLSGGALSFLRAALRSRFQLRASSSESSTAATAAAKSRPVQGGWLTGTRRANGTPFFNKVNVWPW